MEDPQQAIQARVGAIVTWFEWLTPATLQMIDRYYAPAAQFKDPFNDVHGLPAIEAVYRHMFTSLQEPRFRVVERIVQDRQCFLVWDFTFRFRRGSAGVQTVRGGSHLVLDAQGRISLHRDYWDAAGELYEKLPLLGALMRWLKRRVNS
jgi:steroid delta-isomerase